MTPEERELQGKSPTIYELYSLTEQLGTERLFAYHERVDNRHAARMSESDLEQLVFTKMSTGLAREVVKKFPDYTERLARDDFGSPCVEYQSRVVVMTEAEYKRLTGLVARLARSTLRES